MEVLRNVVFIFTLFISYSTSQFLSDFDDVVNENSGEMFYSPKLPRMLSNITDNPNIEDIIEDLAKKLVASIIGKMQIQDDITKLTRETLRTRQQPKIFTAIETRRTLDQLSRSFSSSILLESRQSCVPALHRLVYGLGQIAAEVSIIAGLKDVTYSDSLYKLETEDFPVRRKRSIDTNVSPTEQKSNYDGIPSKSDNLYGGILSKVDSDSTEVLSDTNDMTTSQKGERHEFDWSPLLASGPIIKDHQTGATPFLNKTALEGKIDYRGFNMSDDINATPPIGEFGVEEEKKVTPRKSKVSLDFKAKKSLLYSGEIAFLTAAAVVSMRRALIQSIEVDMAIEFSRSGIKGMHNSEKLMKNLAKTAARQIAKDAKRAALKSTACEKAKKLALRYADESIGSELNHVVNRLTMDILPLVTLAKSMAYVSSQVAVNSMNYAVDEQSMFKK